MLVTPDRRRMLMTRLRRVAMTWGACPVRTGVVFGEGDVMSVQGLDLPVPTDPGGELGGACLVWGQVGDGVDGLGAPAPATGRWAGAAGDLDGLGCVREGDSVVVGVDGDHLDGADLASAVTALGAAVADRYLPPGQLDELATQCGCGVSRAARCPGGSFPKKQPPSSFGVCWSASALDQGLSPRLSDLAGSE